MKPITITENEAGVRVGEYEPGNGTNYKAIAVPWGPEERSMNALGWIRTGWLVVSCNNALAYLLQEHGYLADDYVRDKLGGVRDDYPYMGDLIRALIDRPNIPTVPEAKEAKAENERATTSEGHNQRWLKKGKTLNMVIIPQPPTERQPHRARECILEDALRLISNEVVSVPDDLQAALVIFQKITILILDAHLEPTPALYAGGSGQPRTR